MRLVYLYEDVDVKKETEDIATHNAEIDKKETEEHDADTKSNNRRSGMAYRQVQSAEYLKPIYVQFAKEYRDLLRDLQIGYKNLSSAKLIAASESMLSLIRSVFEKNKVRQHMAALDQTKTGHIITALKGRAVPSLKSIVKSGSKMGASKLERHIDNISKAISTNALTHMWEMINAGVEVEFSNTDID